MDWFLIVLSGVALWVVSFCKIMLLSNFPSTIQHFNNGDTLRKKVVLLVIAHPDDESMFFAPTINYLTARGHNVHILCLSMGNADGMGSTRKDELYKACATLKVLLNQVAVIDHPQLQDGFGHRWNHSLIAKLVEDSIRSNGVDTVITFDTIGVSGHCNHQDVNHGVRKLLLDSPQGSIEAWELISTNVLRKYSGPLDVWFSSLVSWHHFDSKILCLINEHPLKSFYAMAQHMSQWVWVTCIFVSIFPMEPKIHYSLVLDYDGIKQNGSLKFRKFFVAFSSYTYVNTLRRIEL